MKKNIVILGAGRIGRAIECLLKDKGYDIELWDADETKNRGQKEPGEIVPRADFVFLCMPSWFLRSGLGDIKELLKPGAIIIGFQKGVEKDTHKLTPEIMVDVLGEVSKTAYIGGPMIAEECMRGQISAGIVATGKEDVFSEIKDLFKGTTLLLEQRENVRGVALVGVLKNIYAFSLGIANGLDWGSNGKGWLVAKALDEMVEISKSLNGDAGAVFSVAGVGDLIGTGFSESSSNFRHGTEIAREGKSELKSEGFGSLPMLAEMIDDSEKYPIFNALKKIVVDGEMAGLVFDNLIKND